MGAFFYSNNFWLDLLTNFVIEDQSDIPTD